MLSTLGRSMAEAGKACESFTMPNDAGRRRCHGVCVSALAAPSSEENFFWTNPPLSQADTAQLCSPPTAGTIRAETAPGSRRRSIRFFPRRAPRNTISRVSST